MPLEVIYQPERDLTTFLVNGEPSMAEILRTYREVKESYGLTKHSLWDGRDASLSHFQKHDLEMLDHFLALIQE